MKYLVASLMVFGSALSAGTLPLVGDLICPTEVPEVVDGDYVQLDASTQQQVLEAWNSGIAFLISGENVERTSAQGVSCREHPAMLAARDAAREADDAAASQADAVFGFLNLYSDNQGSEGDGLWYPFEAGKTRHTGDPVMTDKAALDLGYVIGLPANNRKGE